MISRSRMRHTPVTGLSPDVAEDGRRMRNARIPYVDSNFEAFRHHSDMENCDLSEYGGAH